MDLESLFAIIFLFTLTLFLLKNRKKIEIQKIIFPILYFVLYKTKLGINAMNSFAKRWPRFTKYAGYVGIVVGFIGMGLISVMLVYNLLKIFLIPDAATGVALVLPFKVKGGFFVPFFYWIISIFILAVVHEFSHGVLARLNDIKLKSSGFAFLAVLVPVLPAAFVEPDEKQMVKKSAKAQLSVFAAGPFSNIVLGILSLLISLVIFAPVMNAYVNFDGVEVVDFLKVNGSSPAEESGMISGEVINSLDGAEIENTFGLTKILINKSPGDQIKVGTEENEYFVTLGTAPQNKTIPYIGISIKQSYSGVFSNVFMWVVGLFYWLYVLNIGIGLFNLLPLGPIDGGRMLKVALEKITKDEKKAEKIWKRVSFFFLLVIIINILAGFV
ncbi:site-2 protease family protein [Nanoarchaeota archaeon]